MTNNDTNGNFGNMSDFYLENGNYLKFKVLQLGYNIKTEKDTKIGLEKIRIFISAERICTP